MPDIGHVLSAWGQTILRGKEWRADTVSFSGGAAVLYGCCHAVDESGKAFTVKLPMMQLTAGNKTNRFAFH